MALENRKAPRESGPKEAAVGGAEVEKTPPRFDPAVIFGMSGEQLAHGYALAASKLLEVGPTQTPTRLKAIRFLRLAIAHLED